MKIALTGSEWLARLAKDAQVIDQDPTLANLILAKSLSDSNQSQNQRNRRVLALRLRRWRGISGSFTGSLEKPMRFRKAPGCVKLTSCTPPFLHSQPGLQRFSRSTSNLGSAPGTPADNKRLTRAESARSGALEKSGENELQRSLESSFESIAPVEQRASFVRQGSTPMDMAPDSTSAVPLPSVPLDCWLHRAKTNGTRITKRTVEEAAEASFFEDFPAVAMGSSAVTVGYWTMDVVLSFFTGYLQKGNLILNHGDIARHYLKSWFLPDFLVTTIDIVLTFSGAETDRASTRILRLLRLFRVVRLGKLTRFVAFVRDKFESETAYTQFSLMLLIAGMMLLEHVVACGWLGIGSLTSEPETWTTRYRAEAAAFTVKYTHSLRWAFSQLGIGGTNIEAVNEPEGLYSVVVALVSLITFSTIISSMTSLVSTLQSKRMEQTQQFGLLRRFLRLNKIPEGLGSRVTRFLHYTYQERALNSGDPYILDYLSKSLQAELLLARYRQQLSKMAYLRPLLRNGFLSLQESKTLQTLASQAVSMHDVAEDDVIFCSGHAASYSYFVAHGSMLYLQNNSPERQAPNDSWIAEMCLWSTWTHVGDLMCHSFCKVLAIHVTEFCNIISGETSMQVRAHHYATAYVEKLNVAQNVNDLGITEMEAGGKRSSLASLGNIGAFGNPLRFFDRPFRALRGDDAGCRTAPQEVVRAARSLIANASDWLRWLPQTKMIILEGDVQQFPLKRLEDAWCSGCIQGLFPKEARRFGAGLYNPSVAPGPEGPTEGTWLAVFRASNWHYCPESGWDGNWSHVPHHKAQGQQYNRPIVALLRNWTLLEAAALEFPKDRFTARFQEVQAGEVLAERSIEGPEDLRLHRSSEGTYWVSFSFRSAFLAKLHVSFCHGIPKCKMVASIDASSMTEFTPEALWKKKHRQQQAFKNLNIANLKEDTALVEFSLNPRILLQVDLPSGLWIQVSSSETSSLPVLHESQHFFRGGFCCLQVTWAKRRVHLGIAHIKGPSGRHRPMPLKVGAKLGEFPHKGFGVKELREVRCSGKEPKRMIFSLQVGQPHINALETMHGAFTMLLLDVLTTITIMDFSPKPTVSVNMAGQYQGAAKLGDELSLDCRVEKAGKSLVYTSMTIKSGDKTVFTGQHTKMFNRYVFLHRFYVSNLEAPYEVLGLSPELCFHFLGASGVPWQTDVQEGCETLQFVSGMMLKDQDTLMLSVGVSDCESSFVSLHLATVLELLHPPQPPQKLPKHVAAAGARADRGGPVASALRALRLLKAMAKPMALPGEATRKDVPEALRAQHRLEHLWQKRLAERSRACQEAIDCPEKHLLGKAQLMSESP
ncbi:unnamed protein product [Durusdinium trenchii]|uniref:Uncharacterized protein n=1 Tax=Durusdinium trenchii TaxID=1381693 RepID=A0ABP0KMP3_9DINO